MKKSKYILVNISLANHNNEQFKTKITDLNTNQVYLSGDTNNFRFKVLAAIQFLPNDATNCSDGGHYIMSKKNTDSWQIINGDRMNRTKNFISNTNNICIL
jgi:hypothetical protein